VHYTTYTDKTEEVRRLGMGRLLGDLVDKMQLKTQAPERAPKILVHSTHDTGLAALVNTLDVFDDRSARLLPCTAPLLILANVQLAGLHGVNHLRAVPPHRAGAAGAAARRWRWRRATEHGHPAERAQVAIQAAAVRPRLLYVHRYTPTRSAKHADDCRPVSLFLPLLLAVVRARYQNRNLVLPMCAEDGKHLPGAPEFCTLEAFTERVRELVPRDWEAECAA
jgi:acid phosphatase